MNTDSLWLSFLFGTIGTGYVVYGRKQRKLVPLVCGIGLFVAPYVMDNPWILGGASLALMGVPFFVSV